MYSQEEHDFDVEYMEQRRASMRSIFVLQQEMITDPGEQYRHGQAYQKEDEQLVRDIVGATQKLNFSKFLASERMQAKKSKSKEDGKRHSWHVVGNNPDVAQKLKQAGHKIRVIEAGNTKRWEVFE